MAVGNRRISYRLDARRSRARESNSLKGTPQTVQDEILAVSRLTVTTSSLSGLNAALCTTSDSGRLSRLRPVATSQTLPVWSPLAVTSSFPSGLNSVPPIRVVRS